MDGISELVRVTTDPAYEVPVNEQAEQALLSAILYRPSTIADCAEILRSEHFYLVAHGHIYEAMLERYQTGQAYDVPALALFAETDPYVKQAGGRMYLVDLLASVVTVTNNRSYAQQLIALYKRRSIMEACTAAIDIANNPASELDALEYLDGQLNQIVDCDPTQRGPVAVADGMDAALSEIQDAANAGDSILGLHSGLTDLDRRTGGFLQPGNFSCVLARPSMGKTALGITIMLAASKAGKRVLFFSLEMRANAINRRLIAAEEGIPVKAQPTTHERMVEQRMRIAGRLKSLPFMIDDTAGLTVAQIERRLRGVMRRMEVDLVVIDHLGKVSGADRKAKEYERITQITGDLANMAKATGVPVLLLVQLSRENEKRDDKRPTMSDARGSGSIEQDADVMIGIYREEYYLNAYPPRRKDGESKEKFTDRETEHMARLAQARGKAELIVMKNRDGEQTAVTVAWDPARMIFKDVEA